MNPPYDGNLHLKILSQTIPMITNDGICVNLSPIRWLQDPLAEYKNKSVDWYKFEYVRNHIWGIGVVTARDFQGMFNVIGNFDLGVYTLKSKQSLEKIDVRNKTILKLANYNYENPAPIEENKYRGLRVRIPLITAGKSGGKGISDPKTLNTLGKLLVFENGYKDGKQWWEHYNANQFTKKNVEMGCSILFESKETGINFIKSFDTIIGKFYCGFGITDVHVNKNNVLWMGSVVNPRTGLKGYESDWTDEDFRRYFNINDSEWNEILEIMNPYL